MEEGERNTEQLKKLQKKYGVSQARMRTIEARHITPSGYGRMRVSGRHRTQSAPGSELAQATDRRRRTTAYPEEGSRDSTPSKVLRRERTEPPRTRTAR